MTSFVLDNSVVLAWCLEDEAQPLADRAMRRVTEEGAVAPGIWWYELRDALISNERRGRLSAADTRDNLADLAKMHILLDSNHDEATILDLARRHRLSAYDAAYLEVAMRRGLPLASLDRRLREAAAANGIELLNENDS